MLEVESHLSSDQHPSYTPPLLTGIHALTLHAAESSTLGCQRMFTDVERMGTYQLGPETKKFYQLGPEAKKFYQLCPEAKKFCQLRPEAKKFYQLRPEAKKFYQLRPEAKKFYQLRPEAKKFYQLRPEAKKFYQLRLEAKKFYQLRPDLSTARITISLCRADHLPRGVLPSVVRLSVIVKHRQSGGLGPLGGSRAMVKKGDLTYAETCCSIRNIDPIV